MSRPLISYVSRPDATPEGELSALSAVYRFLLADAHPTKEGGPAQSRPDDAKGSKHDSRHIEYTR